MDTNKVFVGLCRLLEAGAEFLEARTEQVKGELARYKEGEDLRKKKAENYTLELDARKAELEARKAKAEGDKKKAQSTWRNPKTRAQQPRRAPQQAQEAPEMAVGRPVIPGTPLKPQEPLDVRDRAKAIGQQVPPYAKPLTQRIKGIDRVVPVEAQESHTTH